MQVLAGKRALVTGGSRGIGRSVALALADAGAKVAVAARTTNEIQAVAQECGRGAIAIPLDVTSEESCLQCSRRAISEMGGIDVLVHCAGVGASHKFTELTTDEWRRVMSVDLDGPFLMIRSVLPAMLAQGGGTVGAIASIAARVGMPYLAAYTAAKHGLLGLVRSLAADYAGAGITFNCLCPGYVDTAMTESTVENIMSRTGRSRTDAVRPLLTPQGRLVAPEEVAAACVFLASDAGRSITGQAINIDGGKVQS
jgi:NAD(P)-dependent dehydrogenase (short-subunit alcohol dehydrogenase family)